MDNLSKIISMCIGIISMLAIFMLFVSLFGMWFDYSLVNMSLWFDIPLTIVSFLAVIILIFLLIKHIMEEKHA